MWFLGKKFMIKGDEGTGTSSPHVVFPYLFGNLGSGFGVRQLEQSRQFYRTYPIANTLRSQLNWSQYRRLIQIEDPR